MDTVLFTHALAVDFDTRWEIERKLSPSKLSASKILSAPWVGDKSEEFEDFVSDPYQCIGWLVLLNELFENGREAYAFFSTLEKVSQTRGKDFPIIIFSSSASDIDLIPGHLRSRLYLINKNQDAEWDEHIETILKESFSRQRVQLEVEQTERRYEYAQWYQYRLRKYLFGFLALFIIATVALYFIPLYFNLQEHAALLDLQGENPDAVKLLFERQRFASESVALAAIFVSLIGTLVTTFFSLRTDRRSTKSDLLLTQQMQLTIEKLELEVRALKSADVDEEPDRQEFKQLPGEKKLLGPKKSRPPRKKLNG